jgi:CHAT domain-containing protein/tetratricopeptide (TPR) repeat protein
MRRLRAIVTRILRGVFPPVVGAMAGLVLAALPSAALPPQASSPSAPPTQAVPLVESPEARAAGQRAFDATLQRKWDEAERHAEEAIRLARDRGDQWAESLGLRLRGGARVARRRFDEGMEDLEHARDGFAAINDQRQLGHTLRALGDALWNRGRREESGPFFEAAADAFRKAGLPVEEAYALRAATFSPGDFARKLELLRRAWALVEPLPSDSPRDRAVRGGILHQWGDTLFGRGDYAEAVVQYERALPWLERDEQSRDALASLLTSLGRVQRAHGYAERALPYYVRALGLQRAAGDRYGEMQSLNAIGVTLRMLSRLPEALDTLQQARTIAQHLDNTRARTYIDGSLGVLKAAMGDAEGAAETLARVRTELGDPATFVSSGFAENLAMSQLKLGHLQEVVSVTSAAIDTWGRLEDAPPAVIGVLMVRSEALRRLGRTDEALRDARDAVERREQLRQRLVPLDFLKRGALDAGAGFQDMAIGLHADLGQPAEALATSELGRARALLDLMASYAASSAVPAEVLNAARGAAGPLPLPAPGAVEATRGADASSPHPTPPAAESGSSPPANAEPLLASSASVRPPDAREVARLAGQLGSTILSFWVTDKTLYAWVVGTDGEIHGTSRSHRRADLERLVRRASSSISEAGGGRGTLTGSAASASGSSRPLGPYRALYDLLVAPLETWLPRQTGARLTIVPHGPLFRVAFAALQDPRGRYLIERYSLHYTPSLGVLSLTRPASQAASSGGYLVVADPAPLPRGLALPRLAGARREARDIASLGRRLGVTVTTLEGASASEPAVRAQTTNQRVVHLAAHGLVNDDAPFESYIALGTSGNGGPDDGKLTAAELYDLSLTANLVVLSACRSADGKVTGDGIVGLTRGFLVAGAQSVLASLWDLPDETAGVLLPQFYQAWSRSPSKAEALRAAQLHVLRALRSGRLKVSTPAGEFALPEHPSLWAGLVLFGGA